VASRGDAQGLTPAAAAAGMARRRHVAAARVTNPSRNPSFLSRSNIRPSRKLDRRVPERAAVTVRVAQLVAGTYVSQSGAVARLRCGRGRGTSVGLCAGVGASSPVTTSIRCRNDRPSRSRRHTTSVSPGRSCSRTASSCGRRSSAPAARSVQTFHHPAAASSSTCRSGFCSVVAGGGVPVVAGEHRHDDDGWRQVGVPPVRGAGPVRAGDHPGPDGGWADGGAGPVAGSGVGRPSCPRSSDGRPGRCTRSESSRSSRSAPCLG